MSSNESAAYEIMQSLDVDYVLVIFGGVIGYSGDDINKFLWMVRIAEGEHPKDIRESDYFTDRGEFRVDAGGSPTLLNCLMYKLSYYRFGEVQVSLRIFWYSSSSLSGTLLLLTLVLFLCRWTTEVQQGTTGHGTRR